MAGPQPRAHGVGVVGVPRLVELPPASDEVSCQVERAGVATGTRRALRERAPLERSNQARVQSGDSSAREAGQSLIHLACLECLTVLRQCATQAMPRPWTNRRVARRLDATVGKRRVPVLVPVEFEALDGRH